MRGLFGALVRWPAAKFFLVLGDAPIDLGDAVLGVGPGVGLGLPGGERVFDDANVRRILDGRQAIDVIPSPMRAAMVELLPSSLMKPSASSGVQSQDCA